MRNITPRTEEKLTHGQTFYSEARRRYAFAGRSLIMCELEAQVQLDQMQSGDGRDRTEQGWEAPDRLSQGLSPVFQGSLMSPALKSLTPELYLSNSLECAVCLEPLYRAMRLDCGHSFCEQCVEQAKQHSSDCPSCRAKGALRRPSEPMARLDQLSKKAFPKEYKEKERSRQKEVHAIIEETIKSRYVVDYCVIS
jgi:hypothetical protein